MKIIKFDNLIPGHFWILQHLVSCALSKLQSGLLLPMPFVRLCVLICIPLPHVLEQKLQSDHLQAIKQKCSINNIGKIIIQ